MVRDPDGYDTQPDAVTAFALRGYRGIRNLPVDLAAVAAFVVVTNAVTLGPVVRDTPLRVLFGLPFVLFVPGYAFTAALFPEAGGSASAPTADTAEEPEDRGHASGTPDGGIDGLERVALSFGLSIAIVPLIGLVLNFTPWGIRLVPILLALSAFTLVSVGIAAFRRWELPEHERFQVPYRRWAAAGRAEFFAPDTRADAVLNVMLVLSIVLAASSVGFAVVVPQEGESFSELYLLTETDDGDLVADGYPTNFTSGEGRDIIVGVTNQEHEPTNYTLLVDVQRVRTANNSTTVLESDRLRRFDMQLSHNETRHRQHMATPTLEGENLRLTYLLYRGEPPATPTVNNSYREVHLWINVSS